jgi:hypothetical protein
LKASRHIALFALLAGAWAASIQLSIADDIYESALPPPLRSQPIPAPIVTPSSNSGSLFMMEEQSGESPQAYYASPSNQESHPGASMSDNSVKIRPLPNQWAPSRPDRDGTINFGDGKGMNVTGNRRPSTIVSQTNNSFIDTNGFQDRPNVDKNQGYPNAGAIGSGNRNYSGYPAQNSGFNGNRLNASGNANGYGNAGFNTQKRRPDPLSPDYDNSMRKPDRFADNPVVGPDGVRHFSNGKHFDLSQMSIDQAISTVNTPDPNIVPPPKRKQNPNQTALNDPGFNNQNFDNSQQRQMRQERRRRRELNNLMNGF